MYIFYQVTAHSYVISIIVTQKFAAAPSLFLSVEQVGGGGGGGEGVDGGGWVCERTVHVLYTCMNPDLMII